MRFAVTRGGRVPQHHGLSGPVRSDERVKRADRLLKVPLRDVQVDQCGVQIRVTEQVLDGPDVSAGLQIDGWIRARAAMLRFCTGSASRFSPGNKSGRRLFTQQRPHHRPSGANQHPTSEHARNLRGHVRKHHREEGTRKRIEQQSR